MIWNQDNTPQAVSDFLRLLSDHEPDLRNSTIQLILNPIDSPGCRCRVTPTETGAIRIEYNNLRALARGVGSMLSGLYGEEHSPFETLGVMLDLSRNQVLKVDYLKMYFRRLALAGYNQVLLYCEDTYQLPDEPFWGYMRGAYSLAELRELDAYAKILGIELTACIQTLGHLEQITRWHKAYGMVTDTRQVLLVDEEATGKLIEKMIQFWSEALSSRKIHIGMDETHDLGRGKFMDRHGWEPAAGLFNRHLDKVNQICSRYGYQTPMIWSDMYFRLANAEMDYYDTASVIPQEVVAAIPANIRPVYWDYIHKEESVYEKMLLRHREIGFEPVMASVIWSCMHFWYGNPTDTEVIPPCLAACRKTGVKELFFCLWGDDGAYCNPGSALAGLAEAADRCFGKDDPAWTARRFNAICHSDYQAHVLASTLQEELIHDPADPVDLSHPLLLWDDPLMGIVYDDFARRKPDFAEALLKRYENILAGVRPFQENHAAGNFAYLIATVKLLQQKILLRRSLTQAYDNNDGAQIREIVKQNIPDTLLALEKFDQTFRNQWLACAKPFGLEVIQIRNGGLRSRLEELSRRLEEYLAGTSPLPEELAHRPPASAPSHNLCYYRNAAYGTTAI